VRLLLRTTTSMSLFDQLPVVVIGAGGHAAVVVSSLFRLGVSILGATRRGGDGNGPELGIPIIGDDSVLEKMQPSEVMLVNGIGMTVPAQSARCQAASRLRSLGFRFRPVIDPTSIVAAGVEIKEGAQVLAGAVIQPRTVIGVDTIVNTGACIDHDCEIGAHSHICPGVTITGNVRIGSGSLIGAGTIVTPGVFIEKNSMIKAGSIITSR
jgi:sugar O-acyltransferase (sialic acid O-acetyltransferase NeuD family)